MPTTNEIRALAIQRARDKGDWIVLSEGNDYAGYVIAYHEGRHTNWYREMIIIDGEYEVETVRCQPPLVSSGQISDRMSQLREQFSISQ